jgi:hypothetical protein
MEKIKIPRQKKGKTTRMVRERIGERIKPRKRRGKRRRGNTHKTRLRNSRSK